MAARPKSGITADTDVNLDFLTKEEKEALLSKKMDMIRQRNKALTERHKLIEADKKKAEEAGQAVQPALESQSLPAEGAPKSRGRGRGQPYQRDRDSNRPAKERPKSSGDFRDSSNYEPIVDTSDLGNHRGRGRGGSYDREPPAKGGRRKPQTKEEATVLPSSFDYEPIVDMTDLDKRFGPLSNSCDVRNYPEPDYGNHSGQRHPNRRHDDGRHGGQARGDKEHNYARNQRNTAQNNPDGKTHGKAYEGRLKDGDGPPPDPSFNPLADRRRSDNKKEEGPEYRRHPRNYGGGADLARVKQNMKNNREKEKERPPSNKPLEMVMTGKERKNHEEWKAERERYDLERIQRQKSEAGSWKRAWDADKIQQDEDDAYASRLEPAKRPAGRIGSGRFDRGERDDRPRSAVIGKGGLQQLDNSQPQQQQQPRQHHHADQQQPLSPTQHPHHPQIGEGNNKAPRGRGRGRGKSRGRGNAPGGEKSARPRTWSGGDNRFVECERELLLVKFDNTAGDNSVEVEYDDGEFPTSPPTTPKSSGSSTTPGRGPTGRTPNQSSKPSPRGGKGQQPQKNKGPRHKARPQSGPPQQMGSTEEDWDMGSGMPQTGLDQAVLAAGGYNSDEARVRTSSHSQSYGDSEEWEDCTESSGVPEEEDYTHPNMGGLADNSAGHDLHLECRLNPEAPEFLPTSPDFMKTPPGHVKVLNWAADGSLSQGSVTSPPPQPQGPSPLMSPRPLPNTQSPASSPGSSASTRAMRRREEVDVMPEEDQPHPPPFLLAQGEDPGLAPSVVKSAQDGKTEEKEEEDEEKFEDSFDDVTKTEEEKEKETVDTQKPPESPQPSTSPGDGNNKKITEEVTKEESPSGSQGGEPATQPPSHADVGKSASATAIPQGQEKEEVNNGEIPQASTKEPASDDDSDNELPETQSEEKISEKGLGEDLASELARATSSEDSNESSVRPTTDLASELAQADKNPSNGLDKASESSARPTTDLASELAQADKNPSNGLDKASVSSLPEDDENEEGKVPVKDDENEDGKVPVKALQTSKVADNCEKDVVNSGEAEKGENAEKDSDVHKLDVTTSDESQNSSADVESATPTAGNSS